MANEFKVKHGLIVNGSGSTVLDVQGSQGQLFSITDSLSGSLFSVGDISGIPILEVFSDDTVKVGSYGSEAIIVSGSHATVSGSFSGSFQGDGSGLTGLTSAQDATITLTAGTNLSGGGSFTTNQSSADTITFNLDLSGTNIISGSAQLPSGTVSGSSQIDHDQTTNFVANEHIDHSSVAIGAGVGLSGGGDLTTSRTLNLDFSELTDMTGDISGTTEFILQNGTTESRKAASEIKLSNFNNDSGWTSNTGDITRVNITAGGGLTGNQDTTTGDHTQTIAVGAGTGVTVNADNVAIGQDVATTANVTFATASISQNLTVGGDLVVLGDAVEIQVGELSIEDKNILIASGAADSAAADGAGLTIGGANESITWDHSNSRFNISDDVNVAGNITLSGTVDGVDVAALETTVNNLDTSVPAIVDNSGTPAFNTGITKAEVLTLLNAEDGATADQTDAEIETAYNNQVGQVSSGEITAGTETGIRRFSVADIKSMIDTHETDTNTTYSAGTGIALSGTTFNLDFSELTDKTTDIAGTTEFILQDGTTESRKAASEIKLSAFNNDSGFTSNTGDVTGVTLAGDSGTASDSSGNVDLTIAGGTNITTSATGTTLTINNGITNNNQLTNGAGYTTNTGTVTEVTVGSGLDVATGTTTPAITLDLSELTDMTAAVDGTADELILLDSGAERRKLVSEINLGQFNNDQGWTSNTGDITEVSAGTGLSGGGTSGAVTLNLDFSELTDKITDIAGTTEFIIQDGTTESRKAASEIKLSNFNNDSGWTSNAGTVTSVATGTGLTGGTITSTGTLSLSHLGLESLSDPNDDRIAFWDDSAGAFAWLDIGSNLTLTGTTLTAANDNTTYSAGTGLALSGTTFNLDFSELTDKTTDIAGTTEFIIQDGTTESRKAASEIKLSNFNNDSGWTSNTGDVTGVTLAGDSGTASDSSGNVDLTIAGGTNITTSATGTTLTINNGITNNNQLTNGAGYTTNTGTVTSVATGTGLTGGTITSTGTLALSHLGLESLSDPNDDRIAFWDDSAGAFAWLDIGSNLTLTGTTLTAANDNTTYTAGALLDLAGTQFAVDLSELTDMTQAMVSTDELVVLDSSVQKRKAASEINLSIFNNDSGFTSNTGDVTGVTLAGDSGTASDSSGNVDLTIAGGTNITTSATGTTLTINNGITNNNQLTNGAGYTTNTGTVTEVTVGTGLDVATGTTTPSITLDLSEFTDMTAAVDGAQDELILLDNGAERRKLISEINLGQFNNDQGWTNNTGTVDTSGTPADNQLAVFTDSDTIEGTTGLTYDGSDLGVTGDINITKIGGVELTLAAASAGSTTIGLNPNTSGFGNIWTTDTSDLRIGSNATTAITVDGSSQEVSIAGNINTTGYVTGSFYNDRVSLGTNVDFSAGQVFTKTLAGNTTLTFSNYKVGMVKDLRIIGDFSLTFPAGCNVIGGGTYDGTAANFIQVICIDQSSPEFWVSISRV